MIKEIHTGNRISRVIYTALGSGIFYREYVVPDVLDHRIPQPGEISIHLEGPKDNITVTCDTPNRSFPFSAVVPEGTTFAINASKFNGYQARTKERKILIPSNVRAQAFIPAFAIIHEGGHIWQANDEEWNKRYVEACKVLNVQLFSRAIDGYVWLPEYTPEREHHMEAWLILGEEERRASAIALYTVGRLRAVGVDPLPQYRTITPLAEVVNVGLKSHEQFKQRLRFTEDEVADFLAGDLPIPNLSTTVASYLDKTLQTITPAN